MRTEFLIVGGGIVGCATAWELARRGASVALFEADEIASGASGGPGKRGLRANARDERELPLARLALERWPWLESELGAPTGWQGTGGLALFEHERSRERAERLEERQQRHGVASRLVSAGELHELEPDIGRNVIGAILCPAEGVADHTMTTRAYARAARRAGAELREGEPIASFELLAGRVRAVRTARGARVGVGRACLVAANQASRELVAALGADLEILPVLPQVLFSEPVPTLLLHHLLGHLERTLAVKRAADAGLMISGGYLGAWDGDGSGVPVAARVEANRQQAAAVLPGLSDVPIARAHADRPESVGPEALPVIDRVPGVDNLWVAAGWSGHGFAIAPAVGEALAGWLRERRRPGLLAPFAWRGPREASP